MIQGTNMVKERLEEIDFPPLELIGIKYLPLLTKSQGEVRVRPDLIVEFGWKGEKEGFLTEWKQKSTPSELANAIQQLRRYRERAAQGEESRNLPLMVILPYLSPEALDRLIAEEVSGIDLSGNGVVMIPGKWFVYRTGARNQFPSSAPIKNVFSGTSSLVARIFLVRQTFASVSEVREEIRRRDGSITLPTVSKVLKTLQEELLISRGETIRLLDPGRLLDQFSKNYQQPQVQRRVKIKVSASDNAISKFKSNTQKEGILVAGNAPSRYVVMPSVEAMQIYTTSIEKLLRDVEFTETSRFPDFDLIETVEKTVYFDRRENDAFYWVSPVQTYLELADGGKREQEAAAQLREGLLKLRFGD